jgi:hypothetical protein
MSATANSTGPCIVFKTFLLILVSREAFPDSKSSERNFAAKASQEVWKILSASDVKVESKSDRSVQRIAGLSGQG